MQGPWFQSELLHLLGKLDRRELLLLDHASAACPDHLARIGGLMIVRRRSKGNQDRWPAGHGQLRDGRCPGAGDDQMRPGEPLRDIGHVGRQICRNAKARILLPDYLDVLGPALLGDLQASPEMVGQQA